MKNKLEKVEFDESKKVEKTLKFKQLLDNPEPRRSNSLLNHMEKELYDYVVNRKAQRLSVEDEDSNKTLKVRDNGSSNPNDPLPLRVEEEIVRHPLKSGVC